MKKKARCYLAYLLLFLATLNLLGGCVKKSRGREDQVCEHSTEKILNLNFSQGDVPSLDPHILSLGGRSASLGKWLFEGLVRLNPHGDYELAGAEKIDASPCKTRYTVTLRPNSYSDGTSVLAYDYEMCWKAALAPASKCPKAHLFYVLKNAQKVKQEGVSPELLGVKALDEKTLVITLDRPVSYFLNLLAMPLFAPYKMKDQEVVGSGPYAVDQWKRGGHLHLKINPFFWDRENIAIEKVHISMIRDERSSFYLYEKGEIDWSGPPFSAIPTEDLTAQLAKGMLLREEVTQPFWIYLNTQSFPLTSPLMRQALSCVVDRSTIAQHIFIGAKPLHTPVFKGSTLCEDAITDHTVLKGQELFEAGLKELGLTRDDFPTLTLSCCHLTRHKKLAKYLQERWQQAFGIEIHLDVQDWNTFYHQLQKGNFQLGGCFISSDYDAPIASLESLALPSNFPKWQHPRFGSVIEQAKQENDDLLRTQFLREAELILQEEVPVIPIINLPLYYSHCPSLKGLSFDHKGSPDLRWAYFE